ncbi:MAG: methyltransferase domain-containing protein [Pseudomonadota bacterium]
MTELDLIIDLHKDGHRQGPGGDDETRLAVRFSGLRGKPNLKIADIGCGTGAPTLVLAQELDAEVTAVDFLPAFLERLESEAEAAGLSDRITTQAVSMDALTFAPSSLDAIWSEGAIYNIGFAAGVRAWREFLRPGAILAVSELTWLTDVRPAELEAHWTREYPEVATASAKMAILEQAGYAPLGYFPLPKACWLDNYYRPMQGRFPAFLERHDQSKAALAIVRAEQAEIDLFERYSDHFGYGFYIASRTAD